MRRHALAEAGDSPASSPSHTPPARLMSISLSLSTFFFWLTPATFTSPVALRVPRACRSLLTASTRAANGAPSAATLASKAASVSL